MWSPGRSLLMPALCWFPSWLFLLKCGTSSDLHTGSLELSQRNHWTCSHAFCQEPLPQNASFGGTASSGRRSAYFKCLPFQELIVLFWLFRAAETFFNSHFQICASNQSSLGALEDNVFALIHISSVIPDIDGCGSSSFMSSASISPLWKPMKV